jgi:hypothetical protein
MLTPSQQATLKAYIAADPILSAQPMTMGGAYFIAEVLNAIASPAFIVWKTNVPIADTGQAFNGAEWAGMTTANHTRLQTVAQYLAQGYSAALSDIRAMFNDIWSGAGGTITRANLLALWKRSALLGEKVLATGAGSDASPAVMGYEGLLSPDDIAAARES